MFCAGSDGLLTPNRALVPGISCIKPRAPLGDIARELKWDSCSITQKIRYGSMPYVAPLCLIKLSIFVFPVVQPRAFMEVESDSATVSRASRSMWSILARSTKTESEPRLYQTPAADSM